jgi:hypothetical protein
VTLLDIKNHLFSHFLRQTTFSLKHDLVNVRIGEDSPLEPYKEALYRAALDDMEKAGLVLPLDKVNGYYILTQPINTFAQQVVVSPGTAELIADLIDMCGDMVGYDDYTPNKLAITDADISAVGQICFALMDELNGEHAPDSGPPDPSAN